MCGRYAASRRAEDLVLEFEAVRAEGQGPLPADYNVAFTPGQWSTLQATFPDGVCDFSKPGVGFTPTVAWLTYAGGPGGMPLPAAPRSQSGDGRP